MLKQYEKLGLQLCALKPGQKEPVYSGYRDQGLNVQHWEDSSHGHGVGLLHGLSHTCAIDIDNTDLFSEWLESNGATFGDIDIRDLTDYGCVYYSGTPNRMKLIFSLPVPLLTLAIQFRGEHIGELRCVDKKGSSMYDVLPPSLHPSGTQYEWEYGRVPQEIKPLPSWFRDVWAKEAQAERDYHTGSGRSLYGSIRWFDAYITEGCKLTTLDYAKQMGFISEADGFHNGKWMYIHSSNLGTGKGHGVVEMPFGNKLFCYHESCSIANQPISPVDIFCWKHGVVRDTSKLLKLLDELPEWKQEVANVGQQFLTGGAQQKLVEQYEISKGLRLPTVFLEQMASEVFKRQHMKSMQFARLVVIAICSYCTAGNFVHSEMHTPTSIYMLIIGKTGIGKSIIQNTISGLLGNKPLKNFPKSIAGYAGDLQKDRSVVHYCDEFGRKFGAKEKHFDSVITAMMEAFGQSQGQYLPGSYSEAGNRTAESTAKLSAPIVRPCPGTIQVTTWETLKPCIEDEHIGSGYLARLVPFFVEETAVREHDNVCNDPWPENTVSQFKQLMNIEVTVFIQEEPEAKRMRINYSNLMDSTDSETLRAIRNRRNENVLRVSGALAAVSNPSCPVITVPIMCTALHHVGVGGAAFDSAVLERNKRTSPYVLVLDAVVTCLDKNKGKLSITELQKKCSPFKNIQIGRAKGAEARELVLKEGDDLGMWYVDMVDTGAIRRAKVVKLMDVAVEGNVVTWA